MTKEQFLSGAPFYIKRKAYKGDSTYNFNGAGSISRQSRSSVDERVVIDDYECNIFKLGRVGFEGFTFVMGKKVVVKIKFKDLVPFEDQGPEYDGAGFSIKDREEDPELQSHHCDDPSCNCSI
jgi:hypothetical protein